MSIEAFVVSAAMIPMGKYSESSYAGLAAPAVREAMGRIGLPKARIEAVYCGHCFGGVLAGQRIVKEIGLGGIPVTNVENACSSGGTALHEAYLAIAAGRFDCALVIGVDKLTQFGGGTIPLPSEDFEARHGMVMPALYAMRARRYLHERAAHVEDLAMVSVKARRHGALNPYAQIRKTATVQEVLASRMIATPLTLFQCCPTGDGAAALIVASGRLRTQLACKAMRIRASVLHSGQFTSGFRDMLKPEITRGSAQEAYEQAGVDARDLDCVELHDAFSIAELIYYEALGLCSEGESADLLRSGRTTLGGHPVVNPSGGLLAKGHPVGATGVAQVVEMFWQLTGTVQSRRVENARLALTHVTGGGIAGLDHGACAVHIFETQT